MIIYQMQTDRDFEKHAVNFQVLEDNNIKTIHSLQRGQKKKHRNVLG